MEIKIPYKPRNWALKFHESNKRWKVLVLHRRAGKTTACVNHLIRDACTHNDSRYAYIAPYYKQAKAVAWDMLKHYSRPIPSITINEAELRVDYPNGSRIQLFGADNPDALRGLGLWGVIFDEYSQQPSSIFTEVIRPALSDHQGYAIWIGTPKGRNDFYRLHEEHQNDPDWYVIKLRASESEIIPLAEIEDAKKNMSMDEYNQEFECSFDAAIRGAYYAYQLQELRRENRVCAVPYTENVEVNTYWDLGISDYTCIIFAQIIGREIHIIDYYENNNAELEHYTLKLRKKPYKYGLHHLPHDVQHRELSVGKSRYNILSDQLGGGSMSIVPNIPIKDGIEAARKVFPRLWFDQKKTELLLDALSCYTQEWDDKKGMFKDKPLHNWSSHASDALRYLAVGLKDKLENKRPKPIPMKKYALRTPQNINVSFL